MLKTCKAGEMDQLCEDLSSIPRTMQKAKYTEVLVIPVYLERF